MLGLRKVTEADADEINSNICKTSGCGWRKRSIFWDLPYWRKPSHPSLIRDEIFPSLIRDGLEKVEITYQCF